MRLLLLLAAAAPLFAQTCTYIATPNGFSFGSDANSAKSLISTQGGCSWTATPDSVWIHITNPQVGGIYLGTATVTFSVEQNHTTQIRSGTITVGDANKQVTITIQQFAANCATSIAAPTSANVPVTGGNGTLTITSGCPWQAIPSQPWITVSPNTPLAGNNTVNYTVAANTCVVSRSGIVTISLGASAGNNTSPVFSIAQAGSNDNLSLAPTSASFGPGSANGRITVTTGDRCLWNSFSDASWLHITGGSGSGAGVGFITYSVDTNSGPPRTGRLTVGPQVFTVSQGSTQGPGPVLNTIINAASGAGGAVAPGEIVSLFGTNMGPASGIAFGQTIPTTLGLVTVMFGNTPAPLTYVSATQINAIVPYAMAPGGTVPIQVNYNGQLSNGISANVAASNIAIFSADFSGHGPGAILNSDYRLNSNVNPARVGSVVMIYATGGGSTNPPSADAALAPLTEPFPRLTQDVSVTVGGIPAQVLYAGGSPGLVNGLVQINVLVPNGVASGPAVPVVVKVGASQSQQDITLAITCAPNCVL